MASHLSAPSYATQSQSQTQAVPVPAPARPYTPPAQRTRGPPQPLTPEEQSALMRHLSPSPPLSVSPHFYSWGPPPQRPQVLASPSPAPAHPRWPPAYE
ncbi:hypothetical protein EVG20_g3196 [Dentipellis fragilis]|uniref:Uncharacterized protein n=1 Tax=Dentipellis fragilis TaxID=205917 RepID=A0A4Y9Z467_9AGAM|nr:hypothetical protein EVG20_g3196 [Dentipellis fragilis]